MATKRTKTKALGSALQLRGMYRVHIVEQDGRIVGDSGWCKNRIVDDGFLQYLITPLSGGAAKAVGRMMLGTGTEPGAAATSLNGELSHFTGASSTRNRATVSTVAAGSTGIQFRATFLSNPGFVTAAVTISNIGLINNVDAAGTIFSGNTFASSALNTNQDVQATYAVNFANA